MAKPLWITYAWKDNEEGDFDHLVSQLAAAGISAKYDKIALIPGRRLWEQIGDQITKGDLAGWAYLLTPNSLASEPCREELDYAHDRALRAKGEDFPLIGLLHQVPISEVPLPLRIRLCVNLASPDWVEEVRAGIEGRPPSRTIADTPNFKVKLHTGYLGKPNLRAVEFVPRFSEIRYWRIAYPSNGPEPVMKGSGPAGAGRVSSVHFSYVEGAGEINGIQIKFFGEGTALTPSTAAYIVFENEFPEFLAFGQSSEEYGIPSSWHSFGRR